jgi:hypothetical protein
MNTQFKPWYMDSYMYCVLDQMDLFLEHTDKEEKCIQLYGTQNTSLYI